MRWIWLLITFASLTACTATRRNPEACCETTAECERLGTSDAVLCETGQCVNFTCVEGSNACDSPDDCESNECVNNFCTPVGGPLDKPAFDIAYPNVWRRSLPDPSPFNLIVIATGSTPLSLSSLQLKSIADDHPTANVRFMLKQLTTVIPAHQAGGMITPNAEPILIESGLVAETRADTATNYLEWEIEDAPDGTYDITVDVVLTLNSVDFPLHFIVHMVPLPITYLDPEQGTRIKLTTRAPL